MNRSNFLLVLLVCLLQPETIESAHLNGAGSTPFDSASVFVGNDEENLSGRRRTRPVELSSPRNHKRYQHSNDLFSISHINELINMPVSVPNFVRPVPMHPIQHAKSTQINQSGQPSWNFPTLSQSQAVTSQTMPPLLANIQPVQINDLTARTVQQAQNILNSQPAIGYSTPKSKMDVILPNSNGSIASSASSKSSNDCCFKNKITPLPFPFLSLGGFDTIPRNAATLSTRAQDSSSGLLSLTSEQRSRIESGPFKFLLETTATTTATNLIANWKNESLFFEEMKNNDLHCCSSEFGSAQSSELDEEWLNDIFAVWGSGKMEQIEQSNIRPTSETSQLGNVLAAASLKSEEERKASENPQITQGSLAGQPLVRLSAIDQASQGKPAFEFEYAPWIPQEQEHSFLYGSFADLENDFELKPMNTQVESVELAETEEGRHFFRPVFKPFQDYGVFDSQDAKLKAAIEIVRPLSHAVTDMVAAKREESIKNRSRDMTSSRHEVALKYAKSARNLNLIEGDWLYIVLNGGAVSFFDYYESIKDTEEIRKWSVRRCRKLICAMIPSIMFSSNFEEVLIDFLDDFFLPHVLKNENDALESEEEQDALIKEITKIGKEMIKNCISPAIIESYISYIKPLLTENEAEDFYEALVDTMENFTIPKPFVAAKKIKPDIGDVKYSQITSKAEKLKTYKDDLIEYEEKNRREQRKVRYQDDLIRVRRIHKVRSFDTLRVLVTHFPEPIMNSNSRWINENYLKMPCNKSKTEEKEMEIDDKLAKKDKNLIDKLIFGDDSHENQDFFDALFFSRVLRACLVLENTINFVALYLDPFLKKHRTVEIDSRKGFRFFKTVDKFIRITRFNVVSNALPQIINYRRYLIAYLIRNGANWMGIVPSKVQSRAINFEFLSLFEALHLFQVVDPSDAAEREQRIKVLISTKDISYQIPIIYYAYNPIPYQAIARVIEQVSKEVPGISFNKLNAYYEIFAMAKNVDLLPITERKVLKFKPIYKSDDAPIFKLESHNQNLDLRPALPENYEAIFVWNMSRRLKNLSSLGNHLNYPYGPFASRVLLARRFGVSFDASHFIPQLSENFTWLESVDFVNFFLEREAQLLINKSNLSYIDSDLYQVYRVYDSQHLLHKTRQMDKDEPTHHINLLIEAGLNTLPTEESDKIKEKFALPTEESDKMKKKFSKTLLFNIYKRGLGTIEPTILFSLSREEAAKILKWFANENNVPESFNLALIR